MSRSPNPKQSSPLRVTFVVLGVCLLVAFGVYWYRVYADAQEEKTAVPQLALNTMLKDLRTFHKRTGRFPKDFDELQAVVWKRERPAEFGDGGAVYVFRSYYYRLHMVDAHTATIWAAPTG